MPKQLFLGIDVGIRNLSFCILSESNEIVDWQLVDMLQLMKTNVFRSCDDISTADIHGMMAVTLPILFPLGTLLVHHVGIETQPLGQFTNCKMFLIAQLIYNYFHTAWLQGTAGLLQSVRFISPVRKYDPKWLLRYGLKKEKLYEKRKKMSHTLCGNLIRDHNIVNSTLTDLGKCQKTDDLADAFLLALVLLENVLQK